MSALLRHPILWVFLVFVALTVAWDAIGAPVSLITQIAIYTLYGAGVNLLVGTPDWCRSAPLYSSVAPAMRWRFRCAAS